MKPGQFTGTTPGSRAIGADTLNAVMIMTGHTRTLSRCWPTIYWHVARLFPNLRIFFSTIDDEDFQRTEQPAGNWTIEAIKEQPLFPFDKPWTPGQFYTHEPYRISVSPQAVVAQLWQLHEGWRLYLTHTSESQLADIVIRCRPDLWFHSFELPKFPLTSSGHKRTIQPQLCFSAWHGRFGGINDRFAVMGRDAAQHYFTTFLKMQRLMDYGCPLHPESLIKASLLEGEVDSRDILKAEFSTLRTNGELRFFEVNGVDVAHASLRPRTI